MKRQILILLTTLFLSASYAKDTSVEYTYVGDDPIVYYGTRRSESYDLAMKMNNTTLVGKRITAIRVQVNSPAQEITDCSVWLTSELTLEKNENGKKVNVPNILSQEATLTEDGWIEAILAEPYTLTQEPIYIGYSFTNTYDEENRGPIAYSQTRHPDGFYIHTSMTVIKWKDYENSLQGVLPIYVTLEGDFSSESVAINGYATDYPYAQIDTRFSLPFELYNIGSNDVQSIDYSYDIDGIKGSNHIDFATPLSVDIVDPQIVNLSFDAIGTLGPHTLNLTIDKVNDKANNAIAASATLPVEVKELVPNTRVVLEEGTGAWCSACPRGAIAIKELNRRYSDNFIGLAYHYNDPMMVMNEFPVDFPHFPSGYVNRKGLTDPFYGDDKSQRDAFGIEKLIIAELSTPAIAAIEISSEWSDETKTQINATASVAFTTDVNDTDYRVSFILASNGLSGEGAEWGQINSIDHADPATTHPMLQPLIGAGNPIMGYVFDDVVLISKVPYGIEGSLPSSMKIAEWHDVTYNFDLNDAVSLYSGTLNQNLVQNKENLEVVALLIDAKTGIIVNAAKAHVGHKTNIDSPTEHSAKLLSVIYYDLQGRRVINPENGIYIAIEKYDNGTIRSQKRVIRK